MTIPNAFTSRGSDGISRRRFDTPVLVAGSLLSGPLSLGLALLFGSWADTGPGVGPTAASLNEGFSQLYGAAIGLAVGTAAVAFAVRRGGRFVSGLVAGLVGYAIVPAPVLIVTAPSDVSTGESVSIAVFAAILLMPAMLAGAVVGAGIAGHRERVRL